MYVKSKKFTHKIGHTLDYKMSCSFAYEIWFDLTSVDALLSHFGFLTINEARSRQLSALTEEDKSV